MRWPCGSVLFLSCLKPFTLVIVGLQLRSLKWHTRGTCKQRWENTDKYLLNWLCYWNQSTVEFQVYKKFSRNSARLIQRWLHINSLFRIFLSHSLERVGFIPVLHSSTLPGFFRNFFHSLSSLLFPSSRINYQAQPINGLNHTSFPVVFTVFFTAKQSIPMPFQSIGILRACISLKLTGEFTHLHLCFQSIFESPSYNHDSRLSNELQFNRFNSAKKIIYSNTNLYFLFLTF